LEDFVGVLEAKSVAGLAPKFTIALNKHEWVIYTSFGVLLVIFFLLLPRGCRYP